MICEKCHCPMQRSPKKKILDWGDPKDASSWQTIVTYYICKECGIIGIKREEQSEEPVYIQGEVNTANLLVSK